MNFLCFTNCDGKASSLQFKDINYSEHDYFSYPLIEISQYDNYSHSLFFDGVGFKNIHNTIPFYFSSYSENFLNVVIDNLYYPENNYIYIDGRITYSVSKIDIETDVLNIITPYPTVSRLPTASVLATQTQIPIKTSLETQTQIPIKTSLETQEQIPIKTSLETQIQIPIKTSLETQVQIPLETSLESLKIPFESICSSDFNFMESLHTKTIVYKQNIGIYIGCTVVCVILITSTILIVLVFVFKKSLCYACHKRSTIMQPDEIF